MKNRCIHDGTNHVEFYSRGCKIGALILILSAFPIFFSTTVSAQDARELLYNFEILRPNHAPKPKVELGAKIRIEEKLNRGLIAVCGDNQVYLSWRLLKEDPADVQFLVYRSEDGKKTLLTEKPLSSTTDFIDTNVEPEKMYRYEIRTILGEVESLQPDNGGIVEVTPGKTLPYHRVKLKDDVDPQRVAIGDLNGDGLFDFVVMHPRYSIDPGQASGNTDGTTYKLDAYLHDGTFLWRYDLGPGIEPGTWYAPFIVYDFDGSGKAKVALKSADIQARMHDGSSYGPSDYSGKRNAFGRIVDGREMLTVLDGMTGKALAVADWPPRSPRLGDYNRINRNQLTVAWLDGKTPCLIALRGTYKALFAEAWQYKDGSLIPVWKWDGDEENPIVRGQGAHQAQCANVDGDGRDEILIGSAMIDDDGTLLWSSGVGHSDSAILTVVDPSLPGMQVLLGVEVPHEKRGVCLVDAKTGKQIWNIDKPTRHVGGAMAADIDPTRPGLECFAAEDSKGGLRDRYLLDAKGTLFGSERDVPGTRDWCWWDADRTREQLTPMRGDTPRIRISKYKAAVLTEQIEGNLMLIGDLHGDWREELVTSLPGEIRIYSTDIPAKDRRGSLLQDSKYRVDIINRTQGYSQAPTPSFYLGE